MRTSSRYIILFSSNGISIAYVGNNWNKNALTDWVIELEDAHVFETETDFVLNQKMMGGGYEMIFTDMPDIDLLVNL